MKIDIKEVLNKQTKQKYVTITIKGESVVLRLEEGLEYESIYDEKSLPQIVVRREVRK